MISEEEKRIYNSHLAISRKVQNKPFKLRSNFDDFDEHKADCLRRLTRWFSNYSNVKIDDFFIAPYRVYSDVDYYSLDYYLTFNAIKTYTAYMKMMEIENPDSVESLERLRDSLKFIFLFCSEKNLTLREYESYCEKSMPSYLTHLKDHKINFYTLHVLSISKPKIEADILNFMFSDFHITFQKTRNLYYSSTKMKNFGKLAKEQIENKLSSNK